MVVIKLSGSGSGSGPRVKGKSRKWRKRHWNGRWHVHLYIQCLRFSIQKDGSKRRMNGWMVGWLGWLVISANWIPVFQFGFINKDYLTVILRENYVVSFRRWSCFVSQFQKFISISSNSKFRIVTMLSFFFHQSCKPLLINNVNVSILRT